MIVKTTARGITSCPVCGTDLPPLPAPRITKDGSTAGPVSLENYLFRRTGGNQEWSFKEFTNVTIWSYFITVSVKFFVIFTFIPSDETELAFNPLLVILKYLSSFLLGIIPLIYIRANRMSKMKLGLVKQKGNTIIVTILGGVAIGFLLFILDRQIAFANFSIYQTTGWQLFAPTQFQEDYGAFLTANPWNRALIAAPIGAAIMLGEFLYRGVIVMGLLHHLNRRANSKGKKDPSMIRIKVLVIGTLITTLVDFSLTFDVTWLLFILIANFILSALFLFVKNIQSVLIAQLTYVIFMFIFLW